MQLKVRRGRGSLSGKRVCERLLQRHWAELPSPLLSLSLQPGQDTKVLVSEDQNLRSGARWLSAHITAHEHPGSSPWSRLQGGSFTRGEAKL